MRQDECTAFLKWCLPLLGYRWAGFRKVRRTVCKRIARRLRELDLPDTDAYRRYLADHAEEWRRLDAMCRIPIARFRRDRAVFDWLAATGLPALAADAAAAGRDAVRAWSAGCASGEEPYGLRIAWLEAVAQRHPGVRLEVLATDADATMLERARAGTYQAGTLRDLQAAWRERAFVREGGDWRLRESVRAGVTFRREDVRETMPDGPFDLILCRNLAFTYFDAAGQRAALAGLRDRLRAGGLLVLGAHETPPDADGFALAAGALPIHRWATADAAAG